MKPSGIEWLGHVPEKAETALNDARTLMGGEDGLLTRLDSSLATMKRLGKENN